MPRMKAKTRSVSGCSAALLPLLPPIGLLLLITGLPMLQMFWSSWFSISYGVRRWMGLAGYRFVLQDEALRLTLNITLVWSLVTVGGTILIGFLFADGIRKVRGRWASPDRPIRGFRPSYLLLMIAWTLPIFISVPLWRALIYGSGGPSLFSFIFGRTVPLTSSPAAAFTAAAAASIWLDLPFTVLFLLNNFGKIERTLYDSAEMDGCTEFQAARFISLPLLREPLAVLAALGLIGAFKEFTLIFLMTAGGPPMLSGMTANFIVGATSTVGIFLYQTFTGLTDYGITAVFGVFMTLGVGMIMGVWAILRLRNRELRTDLLIAAASLAHLASARSHAVWLAAVLAAAALLPRLLKLSPITRLIHSRSADRLRLSGGTLLPALNVRKLQAALLTLCAAAELILLLKAVAGEGVLQGFDPPLLLTLLALSLAEPLKRLSAAARKRKESAGGSIPLQGKSYPAGIGRLKPADAVRRLFVPERRSRNNSGPLPKNSRSSLIFPGFRKIVIAAVSMVSVLILYLLLWLSFSRGNVVTFTGLRPPFPSTENYRLMFTDFQLVRVLLNTLAIALPVAVIAPLLVMPGAYALSRMKREKGDRLAGLIQTLGSSGGIHTLIPLFFVIGALGLMDSRAAVILIYIGHSVPRTFMLLRAFYDRLPPSFHEQALIEGCGTFEYARRILLPLSLPVLTTAGLSSLLSAWNGFLVPLLFLGSEYRFPIGVALHQLVGSGDSGSPQWSLFAAASVAALLITGTLFFLVRGLIEKTRLADHLES